MFGQFFLCTTNDKYSYFLCSVLGELGSGGEGDRVLAIVGVVEDGEPAVDGHWAGVKLDAVDESGRGAINTLGPAVLEERAQVAISGVRIVGVVRSDLSLVKVELGGNLLGPVGHEVILRSVSHVKDGLLLLEAEVFVLIAVASLASVAQIHEVGHKLVDLVGVIVIRKWECSVAYVNLVANSALAPGGVEDLLKDWVEGLAVGAEVVLKELNLDLPLVLTLGPARVCAIDRDAVVSGRDGSQASCGDERFHFYYLIIIVAIIPDYDQIRLQFLIQAFELF